MVIGLITSGEETAYKRQVAELVSWCQENNLSLNADKTKEMIIDWRRRRRRKEQNTLIHIDEAEVERVKTFKSLRTYISEDLTWSHNCCQLLKKAQQRLRKSTFATFTDVQSRVSSPAPSQRGTEAALLRTGGLSSV